ncbi:MAG: C-methyltransferase [Parcubacteria group bacterium GW2011_GWA2_47_12]|uniref:Methyltransferase n=1 Tax=Candidatus Giovannonibacteria bacterium RIFCSPLOWO2_01_FULL_44_16 TaxID=1798348 RepID=A0A1F5X1H9_9BACT|nr:MAG: C-methyltransferase [Parcubacteria group bacterium GW2011_GWA2_47_12]OGF81749.1 MAG: hypothetical protein A2924_00895 [Candidatus Giovannonibacteria bacterium RIFCSPLOWO2_01_FULL_44_16]
MSKTIKIKKCRVCGKRRIKPFFDLGKQPLANRLLKSAGDIEETYPLSLGFCLECGLVQLNHTVPPKKLFSKYLWVTGTSKGANIFASEFCERLLSKQKFSKKSFVFEPASNDGTFLVPFQKKGFRVLGADPAKNIVDMANKKGIPTERVFFGRSAAKKIINKYGKADIIFARNVLAHVADTRDFMQGMKEVLSEEGVLAIEVHYGGDILNGLQYDSIYHEHLCYFTLKSIERLLNDFGLYIFDVFHGPISGGALIVYARKRKGVEAKAVAKSRGEELRKKVNNFQTWQKFAKLAHNHRDKLSAMVKGQAAGGLRIAGYGASARSSTLLNFCRLGRRQIFAIADNNKLKQGMYTAGSHIPIYSAEKALSLKPDIILLLAWNFGKEIIAGLKKHFNYKRGYIIPLSNNPRIIKK